MSKSFSDAAATIQSLGTGHDLRDRLSRLERTLAGKDRDSATAVVADDGLSTGSLLAALTVKAMAGQINVVVHALGILVSLPYILKEGEVIKSLSLGAGNTGRRHDLETDRRVAEFKFIAWRGGSESIRQNTLFVDLFNLATDPTTKCKQMYVVGRTEPEKFLGRRRAIRSVLSKHSAVQAQFTERHGDTQFVRVHQYWDAIKDGIQLIDLQDRVPVFRDAASTGLFDAPVKEGLAAEEV